jgi:hypothetical protein
MYSSHRRTVLALFSLSWTPMLSRAQTVVSLNTLATSGKQRMLSQRVMKAYAAWSLEVAPEKCRSVISASLNELRGGNALLFSGAVGVPSASLQAQAQLIDRLAALTSTAPTAASLQQVQQVSEELLINAEGVTQVLMKSGGEAPSALVNLAARQRLLSQRAAAAYYMHQTPARAPEHKARANAAAAEFKAAISAFDDASSEFPQLTEKLQLAKMQLVFLNHALANIDSPTREQFSTVATTSERILSEMDAMTNELVRVVATRDGQATAAMATAAVRK